MTLADVMGVARKEKRKRQSLDFSATPPECVEALLAEEERYLAQLGTLWEPCAGDGAIVRVLEAAGFRVARSDLVDRGCPGTVELQAFLQFEVARGSAIITNPPFGSRFPIRLVEHALRLGIGYVALLLPAAWANAADRLALTTRWELAAIYSLTWRPDFTGEGRPVQQMTWYVWDARRNHQTIKLLARPHRARRRAELAPLFGGAL